MMITQIAFKSISHFSSSFRYISKPFYFNNIFHFSQQNNKDQQERYKYPFNFNREQYKGYIKKVQKAQKIMNQIESSSSINNIPRRKRRIYDRPKFDTNLNGYSAWRLYDLEQLKMKHWEHSLPVKAKLKLQPKWVVHAFGLGLFPHNHHRSVHRQYIFQDNNLSRFLLYQFRNTTHFKENQQNYDYQNQQNVRKSNKKIKRLQPKDFWQSQEYFQFRVNSTTYAQHMKFCKWIQNEIQTKKKQQSYQSFIDKKFGQSFTFNKKTDFDRYKVREPFIINVSPQHFQQQTKKVEKDKTKKQGKQKKVKQQQNKELKVIQIPKPKVQLEKKLSQQFRKQSSKKAQSQAK